MLRLLIVLSYAVLATTLSQNTIESIKKELKDELNNLDKLEEKKTISDNGAQSTNGDDDILAYLKERLRKSSRKEYKGFWEAVQKNQNAANVVKKSEERTNAAVLDMLETALLRNQEKKSADDVLFEELMAEVDKKESVTGCKKDEWSKEKCKVIVKHKYCKLAQYEEQLKKVCHESCGYCRTPSPPACQMHPDGCCWDGKTFVKDGCPVCMNTNDICKRYGDLCTDKYDPGKWMRRNCPVKCKLCVPNSMKGNTDCQDYKQYSTLCKQWLENGRCNTHPINPVILEICPKTCGQCRKI